MRFKTALYCRSSGIAQARSTSRSEGWYCRSQLGNHSIAAVGIVVVVFVVVVVNGIANAIVASLPQTVRDLIFGTFATSVSDLIAASVSFIHRSLSSAIDRCNVKHRNT